MRVRAVRAPWLDSTVVLQKSGRALRLYADEGEGENEEAGLIIGLPVIIYNAIAQRYLLEFSK